MKFENENLETFEKILIIKAKLFFYNYLDLPNPKIIQSCVYFTLAAELGNPEGQYYTALCHQYGLDNFKEKKILKNINYNSSYWDYNNYAQNRSEKLTITNLYSSALGNYTKAKIAMGVKYTVGDGLPKDCPSSIAYLKDPAYKEAVFDEYKTYFLDIKQIENEMFNLGVQPFKISTKKKSKEFVESMKLRAEQGKKIEWHHLGFM